MIIIPILGIIIGIATGLYAITGIENLYDSIIVIILSMVIMIISMILYTTL